MADEELIRRLSELIDRRRFLRRVGGAALGVVAALVGAPGIASALYSAYCCNLCNPNSGQCSGCACTWCWYCPYGQYTYICCECHSSNVDCGENCNNVPCSYAKRTHFSPVGAPSSM